MTKKILIVDDSASVRTVARMALRERGYDVVEASNGQEALVKLEGERCHLVISDVNMPTMDGITLLKEIKRHPNYKFTPVIMLTTESSEARPILARNPSIESPSPMANRAQGVSASAKIPK